jgi:hypothetical protein
VVVLRSLTGPASVRSGIRSASIRSAIVAAVADLVNGARTVAIFGGDG